MGTDQEAAQPPAPVRGPFLDLAPHPDSCRTSSELQLLCERIRSNDPDVLLAADLFSGAGGLSLGLQQAGVRVVISADHDPRASETHRHHFAGLTLDLDLSDASNVEELADVIRKNRIDVLAGGPPCQPFSKAGRSRIKGLVRSGSREPHDERRDLWRSFLEVARLAQPRAIIMENVPDMALDREMFILRSMFLELGLLSYSVQARVLEARRYGVPQLRRRLILVALKGGLDFHWPEESTRKITLLNAISDLPPVKGGWRPSGGANGWARYRGPITAFQRQMREGVASGDAAKIYDQITRPVREDDLEAFKLLEKDMPYSELPERLKRYRDDIFDDKYKRLDGHDVSRTITAHIAKDGYWYIHPDQHRTLTVREAARIQTFPDWFRFAGAPSSAFHQIGNAVPPLLGQAVGEAVVSALRSPAASRPSTEEVSKVLADWFLGRKVTKYPWLRSSKAWSVIVGETLLPRASNVVVSSLWPLLQEVDTPSKTLGSKKMIEEILSWIGREDKGDELLDAAQRLTPTSPNGEAQEAQLVETQLREVLPSGLVDLAELADAEGEEPIIAAASAVRAATRFGGGRFASRNRWTDGRIEVASLVGYGSNARAAHLGLLELGAEICTPQDPECESCPLAHWCIYRTSRVGLLPLEA